MGNICVQSKQCVTDASQDSDQNEPVLKELLETSWGDWL